MKEFIDYVSNAIDFKESIVCEIGGVIGTHTGPGCLGIAYIPES